jgi:hypothetical protein
MPGHESSIVEHRKAGRISTNGIRSSVGVVLDASAGGLRVKGKPPSGSRLGSVIDIVIENDTGTVSLRGEIRWMQRHPLRGSTFGLSLVDVADEDRRMLFTIVRNANIDTRCRWNAGAA